MTPQQSNPISAATPKANDESPTSGTVEGLAVRPDAERAKPLSARGPRGGARRTSGDGRGGRWSLGATLTHPVVTWGMAMVGVSTLSWSMFFRLPDEDTMRPVYASSAMIRLPELGANRTALNEEAIEGLRRQVMAARSYLVQSNEDLAKLIAETERLALESGWRAEVSLKAPVPAPHGLDRTQWHPAEMQLTNLEGNSQERRAYLRLLQFMQSVKALGKKIELTGLNLKAGPEGLQSAEATLILWRAITDEKPAAR